jgi:hypothetical protein
MREDQFSSLRLGAMNFEERLERAIGRGQQIRESRTRSHAQRQMSDEEFRALHSKYRLDFSEHIESCLRKLADYFPGFRYETLVGEEGWGAKISRDDVRGRAALSNLYSRLEMVIRPYSATRIVELAGKATIHNKEAFNRTHFQFLTEVDPESFTDTVDLWAVEYAELYAARS